MDDKIAELRERNAGEKMMDELNKLGAAKRTLDGLGYTYHGGELWKPPLGDPPDFDLIRELRAEIARLLQWPKGGSDA